MKVLITGGVGFIGFHLARSLVAEGWCVDLLDSAPAKSDDTDLLALLENDNIRLIVLDLRSTNDIARIGADYTHIVHLAAMLGVENVINHAYDVLGVNALLTLNVVEIAKRQKGLVQFMFASTSEVYAGSQELEKLTIPTPELSNICLPDLSRPRTSYMLSKIYGEALCRQSGLPVTIIRPHNIYGPRMGIRHVIPQLLQRAYLNKGENLEVYSPDHTRTFCYVSDAVRMIAALLVEPKSTGNTFNIGNERPEIKIRDLATMVLEVTENIKPLRDMPVTQGSPSRRAPDMSCFFRLMGIKGEVGLQEGLQRSFLWYKPLWDWENNRRDCVTNIDQ